MHEDEVHIHHELGSTPREIEKDTLQAVGSRGASDGRSVRLLCVGASRLWTIESRSPGRFRDGGSAIYSSQLFRIYTRRNTPSTLTA